MKSSWTVGLEPDMAKEIKGDFKSSLLVRKRLKVLLEDKIKTAEDTSLAKTGYDTANWAYHQADLIGYKRALNDIIDLVIED